MPESVCVGVRVRPFNDREKKLKATLCVEMDGTQTRLKDTESGRETPFTFDESFWSHDGFKENPDGSLEPEPGGKYADQQYVFETFGKRVLDNAFAGFHCCLFAYGQTGSGKSYSMIGYGKNKGIIPISCEEIFKRIKNGKDQNDTRKCEVMVSMVEIYNEAVQDLLISPEDRPRKGLEIRESKVLGIYIDGVIKRPVQSYKAIEATIEEATKNRTLGSTLMNATSSRAHTVQAIEFKQIDCVGGKDAVKISMINLVDLAGSEKAGQTGATGDRLKEGAAINKSLSALGNVIERLAAKSEGKGKNANAIIPYRDSKLTRLLQNALGGSSKTIMICALSPASSNYEETLSTLRYADRAKKIKNSAVVNENPQDRLLRELKEENERLKALSSQGVALDPQNQADMESKKKEIDELEKAFAEMQKSFDQKVQEAKQKEDEQTDRRRRTTLGLNQTCTLPMLVNLNEDAKLTGRIKYQLPDNEVTQIGTEGMHADHEEESNSDDEDEKSASDQSSGDDGPDIALMSESVLSNHAEIINIGGECWINAPLPSSHLTFINGVGLNILLKKAEDVVLERLSVSSGLQGNIRKPSSETVERRYSCGVPEERKATKDKPNEKKHDLTERGVKLEHGQRVVFGKCYFFFVAPFSGIPEMMITCGQVSWAMAHKEIKTNRMKNAGQQIIKSNVLLKKLRGTLKRGSSEELEPSSQLSCSSRSNSFRGTVCLADSASPMALSSLKNPRRASLPMGRQVSFSNDAPEAGPAEDPVEDQSSDEKSDDDSDDDDDDDDDDGDSDSSGMKAVYEELHDQLAARDEEIAQLGAQKDKELASKDAVIAGLQEELAAKDKQLAAKDEELKAKGGAVEKLRAATSRDHIDKDAEVEQPSLASLGTPRGAEGAAVFTFPTSTAGLEIGLASPGAFSVVSNSPVSPLLSRQPKAIASMKEALMHLDRVEMSLVDLAKRKSRQDQCKASISELPRG